MAMTARMSVARLSGLYKSFMNNAQNEVEKLLKELRTTQTRDLKTAYGLKQKAFILARKLLGEDCTHARAIGNITFVPSEAIYNEEHPRNKYAWDLGTGTLKTTLEGMKYELGLEVPKLLPPQKMTFGWLVEHVPPEGWVLLFALVSGAFSLGVWLEKHFKIAP